jgi:hypothetical protein
MMDAIRQQALDLAKGLPATAPNIARVAKATSQEAAAWAFTQWSLRASARSKFALAESMVFVREALEQATHEGVAEYHASRFPSGERVADLTCGIGADLIALARRGPAIGFDMDRERADCAVYNLRAHGLSAQVEVADSLAAPWDFYFAFADPARRVESRRTLDPSAFSPDPTVLAERMALLRLGGIKLSPLLRDDFLESLGPRLEFVSFGGECREALVWCGTEAEPGRFAVHVETGSSLEAQEPGASVEPPGEYLFEADPAAIRAHALGAFTELTPLGDSNGYLTGDLVSPSPWLKQYRVLAHGKWDVKAVRRTLDELTAATPVIKQRGAGLDVEAVRKQLRASGERPVAIAVWPVGRSLRFAALDI